MVVILMGPAGAGKTTVGQALAAELGWPFVEGDDYHPPENIAAMRRGRPLTDHDRAEWLARLRSVVERASNRRENVVIACSALKAEYRRVLSEGLRGVRFIYLEASADLLRRRLMARPGHFAGPELLASQLATLERPAHAIVVDAARSPAEIVRLIRLEIGI